MAGKLTTAQDSSTEGSQNTKRKARSFMFRPARQHNALPVSHQSSISSSLTTIKRVSGGKLQLKRKALKMSATPETTPEPANFGLGIGNNQELVHDSAVVLPTTSSSRKRKRKRDSLTKSKLVQWLQLRDSTLDELLRHDGLGSREQCTNCLNENTTIFRCKDCGHGCVVLCKDCIISRHGDLELHRIEKWNGHFFEKSTLAGLGLRIQLGHDGGPCPCPSPGIQTIVFDISGAHAVNVDYCGCIPVNQFKPFEVRIQLLRKKWFPATTICPQTVFTFDCLATFHELTLQGKGSLYDFYYTILRQTDNASIDTSIDRYHQMHRAFRLWRNLMSFKRAGRGQDPSGIDGTSPGSLTVECPACPHPGRNLPEGWEKAEPSFLYTLYLAVDANFKLKGKSGSLGDVELAPGYSVFVEEADYQTHIKNYVDQPESNTCESEHDALVRANTRATPGYSVTGAGLVLCSRHSLVRKNGVGDLQKGERYSNMDYIILSSLANVTVPRVVITYDIACQWSKHFKKRMADFPEQMRIRDTTEIKSAIPSWHINGHGQSCRENFYLGYMSGAGRTCGEEVETNWSNINPLVPSIREMGPAARHDTLSDHWNGWNFQKVVRLRASLLKKFKESIIMKGKHEVTLEKFTATFPIGVIQKWQLIVESWEADPTSTPNPYKEPDSGTTLHDVRLELMKMEATNQNTLLGNEPSHKISLIRFFTTAFEIEDRQFQLRCEVSNRKQTSKANADLEEKRITLQRQIQNWRQAQLVYTPYAATMLASGPFLVDNGTAHVDAIENTNLYLPSSFPANILSLCEMKHVRDVEKHLRIAQANDALVDIRRQRRIIQGLWHFKKINISGTGNRPNTRMLTIHHRINYKIQRAVHAYRTARASLLTLDPAGSWKERLKELRNEDIRGPGRDPDNTRLTNGRFEPSWIWLVPRTTEGRSTTTEDEINEGLRVEWMKMRARTMRWQEEVQIVEEEMRRVLAWYDWKAAWWESRARVRKEGDSHTLCGIAAYAYKQAYIVQQMAVKCATDWLPELKKKGILPSWAEEYNKIISNQAAAINQDDSQEILDDEGEGIEVMEKEYSSESEGEIEDIFEYDD